MQDELRALLEDNGYVIAATVEQAASPGRREGFPPSLDASVADTLRNDYPDGLYEHQARAIAAALDGSNVCISTATASGKSLVFQATAMHYLAQSAGSRVLALYPARALIQDQLGKWRRPMSAVGTSPAQIDGGIPTKERIPALNMSRLILMTPDVAHAWMMSNLHEPVIRAFLGQLRLLILDEAHVYEGAFGTNMAYLLRRILAVARDVQILCTTATLGSPGDFFRRLTGREVVVLDSNDDASPTPGREIIAVHPPANAFDAERNFIRGLREANLGRFLAFSDSRKEVERIVAALDRHATRDEPSVELGSTPDSGSTSGEDLAASEVVDEDEAPTSGVLPYRAGYESADRTHIQRALGEGSLNGVVTTSALELGLDIGDLDIVLLLSSPPSVKSLWQRIGRAARSRFGYAVIVDRDGRINGQDDLDRYLRRALEPNWLYLDNRYIQYVHALCAAAEISQVGTKGITAAFEDLPMSFIRMLANEVDPAEPVPADLYPLKQRGQRNPHYEFPLRAAGDPTFKIVGGFSKALGEVSLPQMLREAYPGAIYYYLARPYRITRLMHMQREIKATGRTPYYSTKPNAQTMVFPNFDGSIRGLKQRSDGFLAEADMQVSERLLGFTEVRGNTKLQIEYAPGCEYEQRPLNRFFETTGVCWYGPGVSRATDATSRLIVHAFSARFGIQERDIGYGGFTARLSPLGGDKIQGVAIYDATPGSLRLTERLFQEFDAVLNDCQSLIDTTDLIDERDSALVASELVRLHDFVSSLENIDTATLVREITPSSDDRVQVLRPGAVAMFPKADGAEEVTVQSVRYTPRGLVYELESNGSATRIVPAEALQPMHGVSAFAWFNLVTGELEET